MLGKPGLALLSLSGKRADGRVDPIRTGILHILTAILLSATASAMPIVSGGQPRIVVQVGTAASPIERHAATMLSDFVWGASGGRVVVEAGSAAIARSGTVVIGTPVSHPLIAQLSADHHVSLDGLGAEGYHVRDLRLANGEIVVVAGNEPRGALYGVIALMEALTSRHVQMEPVDLEFRVTDVRDLTSDGLNLRSSPYYPVRMTIDADSPEWLARHRVNVSGAEGVWTGTGIDDGIGAAVQYVFGFDEFQDVSVARRLTLIQELRARSQSLAEKGIDSYLFMYLTGEPTKALIEARPDLLGPEVAYPASRNGRSYRPFCWSNPDTVAFFVDLIREIMRAHPDLTGLHLRAWGSETRACECPECGGAGLQGQERLWSLVDEIIRSARSVRPGTRFILSGYEGEWLRDPDRRHLRSLPSGTIILQKWGIDGEPTGDPELPRGLLGDVVSAGHHLVVISHDVEEVQPLWMVEASLFTLGVLRFSLDASVPRLGGFTLQGSDSIGDLDRRLAARLNWNPSPVEYQLLPNALRFLHGEQAGTALLRALIANGAVLSDFFSDYAGISSLTGAYGEGSRGFATRLWDLFGDRAVRDILNLPDADAVQYALDRLSALRSAQDEATAYAREAYVVTTQRDAGVDDVWHLMEAWSALFASRWSLIEAMRLARVGAQTSTVEEALRSAISEMRRVREQLDGVASYGALIHANAGETKALVLSRIDADIARMESLTAAGLRQDDPGGVDDPALDQVRFALLDVRVDAGRSVPGEAVVAFRLTHDADAVELDVFSLGGARVAHVLRRDMRRGAGRVRWDGRGSTGEPVARTLYVFRLTARRGEERLDTLGRLVLQP